MTRKPKLTLNRIRPTSGFYFIPLKSFIFYLLYLLKILGQDLQEVVDQGVLGTEKENTKEKKNTEEDPHLLVLEVQKEAIHQNREQKKNQNPSLNQEVISHQNRIRKKKTK